MLGCGSPKPCAAHRLGVAWTRAEVLQPPACQLPDNGEAGARMRAAQPIPFCGRGHQPDQERQRRVQQRILLGSGGSYHDKTWQDLVLL